MINELLTSVGVKPKTALLWTPFFEEMFPKNGVNSPVRIAHYFAQILHESAMLERTREIWGPTVDQKRYERDFTKPWDSKQLAHRLGNSAIGDGKKFMGRGGIQRTGRYNYSVLADKTGLDIINDPALLEQPKYAIISDLEYWTSRDLSKIADQDKGQRVDIGGLLYNDSLVRITKKINPGLRGLLDREKLLHKLKKSLAI